MTGKSDDPRDRECEQRVNQAQLPAIDRFSWCLTNGWRFHGNPPDVVPSQRPPLRYTWSYTEGLWLPGGSRVTRVWRWSLAEVADDLSQRPQRRSLGETARRSLAQSTTVSRRDRRGSLAEIADHSP